MIPVQNINGLILLLSGSHAEAWPSTDVCQKIVSQLEDKRLPNSFEHVIIEGGHTVPMERFGLLHFLNRISPCHSGLDKVFWKDCRVDVPENRQQKVGKQRNENNRENIHENARTHHVWNS